MSIQPANNTLVRALSGSVYVALVVTSVMIGGWVLSVLFGLFTGLLLYEFANLFKHSEYAPNSLWLTISGLGIYILGVLSIHLPDQFDTDYFFYGAIFMVVTLVIWFGVFEITSPTKNPIINTALSVAGILYIVPAMFLVNVISAMGKDEVNTFPLLGIFIMIWSTDTFAYLTGKRFGKTPIAKSISPNKTWEGFTGGLVFTIIAGLIIAYFQEGQPYLPYLVLALFTVGFGLFGDLFESKIKRQLNLKDSGNIIPGHGGILDRFDSVLFVIPVAYLIVYLLLFHKA